MGLQVAAAGKIINEFTGLAFAGGEFETDNPAIRFVSAEAWTKDAQGAHINFATAPIGTSSPVEGMRLTSEGILLVGTDTASGSAKLQVSGAISVSGITYGGTLALSATGANPITFSSGGTEGFRLAPTTRNLLIGTTTDDGASRLQVAGAAKVTGKLLVAETPYTTSSSGGLRVQTVGGESYFDFQLRTSGGGTPRISFTKPAFGGSSEESLIVNYSGNTVLGQISETTGDTSTYRLDVQSSDSSGTLRVYDQTATTGVTSLVVKAGAGQSTNALITINSLASGYALTQYQDNGTVKYTSGKDDLNRWYLYDHTNSRNVFLYTPSTGVYQLNAAGGEVLIAASGGKIGFFGATPVVKQTVTADAASILAALQAYGLAV